MKKTYSSMLRNAPKSERQQPVRGFWDWLFGGGWGGTGRR